MKEINRLNQKELTRKIQSPVEESAYDLEREFHLLIVSRKEESWNGIDYDCNFGKSKKI
jgi:hypothetical protein